ncbi:MAG: HD-GYP domain-containing protein [Clostridia bacterium]|nr:HD-GYP domain-containing protein [Clostridia bacterium]
MNIDFHLFVDNFVSAIEAKDSYTAGHSDRVAEISLLLSQKLQLDDDLCFQIHMAAHLHDIGKIGIPDGILLKTGRLTSPEFEVMKSHSEVGFNILKNNPGLKQISKMILHHHERYDGTGYPDGISGREIPLGARIIAICDAFDAMVTRRTYKDKITLSAAKEEIIKQKHKQFDPDIADTFIELLNDTVTLEDIHQIISKSATS